jgi:hypothetical protein
MWPTTTATTTTTNSLNSHYIDAITADVSLILLALKVGFAALVPAAYSLLGLSTYFTAGPDEVGRLS